MKLYLVQHGEALPKEINSDRPLSDQGRQDLEQFARFLTGRQPGGVNHGPGS